MNSLAEKINENNFFLLLQVHAQSAGIERNITPSSGIIVHPSDLFDLIHPELLTGEVQYTHISSVTHSSNCHT